MGQDVGMVERSLLVVLCTASLGCFSSAGMVVRRASKEFSCPAEKIAVIERGDIADSLFDVDGCGQRARYMCVFNEDVPAPQCIREPNPPRWDVDPRMIQNISVPSEGPGVRRICGDDDPGACFYLDGRTWRWRESRTVTCSDGRVMCP